MSNAEVKMEVEGEASRSTGSDTQSNSAEVLEGSSNKGNAIRETDSEFRSNLTSECPPPPFYYKLFRTALEGMDGKPIVPPKLSDVNLEGITDEAFVCLMDSDARQRLALRKQLFGGTINMLRQHRFYSPLTDYKALLRDQVKNIMTLALDITSNVPPTQPSEVSMMSLNKALGDVHNALGEYRMHEGRESLITLRNSEIEGLQKLAEDMETLLKQQSQVIIKQE